MKKPNPLCWIVPIGYVAALDGLAATLAAVGFVDDAKFEGLIEVLINTCGLLALGFFFANIVLSIVLGVRGGAGRRAFLRKSMLLVKLGLIPFFLFGALVMLAMAAISVLPMFAMLGVMFLPLLAVLGWLIMAGGSSWSIAYAARMRRDGLISGSECALHIVLQLLFVADVADAIALFVRGRSLEQRAQTPPPSTPAPHPAGASPVLTAPGAAPAPAFPAAPAAPSAPVAAAVPPPPPSAAPAQPVAAAPTQPVAAPAPMPPTTPLTPTAAPTPAASAPVQPAAAPAPAPPAATPMPPAATPAQPASAPTPVPPPTPPEEGSAR